MTRLIKQLINYNYTAIIMMMIIIVVVVVVIVIDLTVCSIYLQYKTYFAYSKQTNRFLSIEIIRLN